MVFNIFNIVIVYYLKNGKKFEQLLLLYKVLIIKGSFQPKNQYENFCIVDIFYYYCDFQLSLEDRNFS